MEYRINIRTGDKISVIGLGTSSIVQANESEGIDTLQTAVEKGVNYFDLATADANCFPLFGKALNSLRDKLFYQIHFGADYSSGTYGWTTKLDNIKRSVDWQLDKLKTDYIDYGYIHCIDEQSDWDAFVDGGAMEYLEGLKKSGVVKHIGMSSHTPSLVQKVLDTRLVDMIMFSINPAYDFECGDEYGRGTVNERQKLYLRCNAEGVGITVMKPFCGGQLLDEKTSPFKQALNEYQCIKYALDKPAVLSVLPGVRGMNDLLRVLSYFDVSEEQRDYSVISSFTPQSAQSNCVYCNHCQPCPVGIDVGTVNKYYDLTLAGDKLAANHYLGLDRHAEDCISCGHCNSRCPFKVDQVGRMQEIAKYFKR